MKPGRNDYGLEFCSWCHGVTVKGRMNHTVDCDKPEDMDLCGGDSHEYWGDMDPGDKHFSWSY